MTPTPKSPSRSRRARLTFAAGAGLAVVLAGFVAARGDVIPKTQASGRIPAVGEVAPDFSLKAIDGANVTLSEELEHGPVVVILLRGWVGYHCPFCVAQFGEFLKAKQELQASGARVLWVYPAASLEDIHADAFIGSDDVPSNFRLLLDPGFAFTLKYGLRWDAPAETSYPSTFVLDQAGIVQLAEVSRAHGGRTTAASVLEALAGLKP